MHQSTSAFFRGCFLVFVAGLSLLEIPGVAQEPKPALTELPTLGRPLSNQQAAALANLALAGLDREFPNKPSNVIGSAASVVTPKEMLTAFYGWFDWHSSVHGHWLLVRVLRQFPELSQANEIRSRLAAHFTAENLSKEAAFFADDLNKSYERMYGWAWLLRLAVELQAWDDPEAKQWRANLRPLEEVIVKRIKAYLPLLS